MKKHPVLILKSIAVFRLITLTTLLRLACLRKCGGYLMNWRTDEETPCINLKNHCCLSSYNLNHWPTNWFRGARSFLTSRQFISLSRNFPQLVKTEGSLPSVKLFTPWILNLYFRSVYQLTALTVSNITVWIIFIQLDFYQLICYYLYILFIDYF
jgi:hypothetical protein